MTFTTHVIGSDHIENWDPPCTSLFSARLTFPFFTMPLRARPVHPPVDLPDPEADLASNAAETTELPFEDLTDELHESENEEVECETPTAPGSNTPPNTSNADGGPALSGTLAPKKESTTVSIDTSLLPRLPSDFLEPGDVPVDNDDAEFQFDRCLTGVHLHTCF